MAGKKRTDRPELIIKGFTVAEAKQAIQKLERRIIEVRALSEKKVRYNDQVARNAQQNIRDAILEIYGELSPEFRSHGYHEIWNGQHVMGMDESSKQRNFEGGIPQTVTMLEGLIERLNERLLELPAADSGNSQVDGFWDLLHPRIVQLARSRFESGHLADAVESAFKEVNAVVKDLVKRKTGQEFDGSDLMNRAFSVTSPIVTLDDLSTESGKNIQKGFMQIFSGAMTGVRNPKTHENVTIDEKRAVHFLFLASLLMSKFDDRI